MFSIQQFPNVCVDFFNDSLQKVLCHSLSLAQLGQNLNQFLQMSGVLLMETLLEQTDAAIYETVKPTHQYHVKAQRSRTLTTLWGDVSFSRRYYQNKKDGTYHYLLDEWMDLEKYTHIDPLCQATLIAHAADVSYSKAVALTTPKRLSAQSVRDSIRKLGTIPNDAATLPKPKPGIENIYVEADENHVAMQHSRSKQMKLINVYENKKIIGKGRRVLCGRRTFSGFEAPSVLWPEIDRYIATLYGGGDKKPQVVIKGDAANWIKAGTNYVGYSHTVIDGYHISQYIRKIAGNGDSTCLYQALRANDRDRFIHEVKQKYRHCPNRRKSIQDGYQYILSNWAGIHETVTTPEAASSTEGHVSHMLSDRMSSRGMGWSPLGAEQMARLRTYVANGGNLVAYALAHGTRRKEDDSLKAMSGPLQTAGKRHLLPYYTDIPSETAHMPGRECALTGGWMRLIENSGYQHFM